MAELNRRKEQNNLLTIIVLIGTTSTVIPVIFVTERLPLVETNILNHEKAR